MLDALESGDKFLDIFNSPPTKFLQDGSPRQHHYPGAADQEWPLGAGQGQPDVLRIIPGPNEKGLRASRAQPLTCRIIRDGSFRELTVGRLLLRPAHHYAGAYREERGCIAAPAAAGAFSGTRTPFEPSICAQPKRHLRVPAAVSIRPISNPNTSPLQLEAIGLQTANEDMTTISISAVTSALFSATWLSI